MSDDWTQTAGLDQRLVERCQNLEARIKELEQRLADEVNVSIELNRELILKRLEKCRSTQIKH